MNFMTSSYTDVGTRKKTNQDSMIIMEAATDFGNALFASVCDGMGGLAKGEVPSAAMVRSLERWFEREFPLLIAEGFTAEKLWNQWTEVIRETSRNIEAYGVSCHTDLGTTCTAILIFGDSYYIVNVGDSRVYLISDNIYLLTKDQTFVQREVDAGRMTIEQSMIDPNRSVLLQCIGASKYVEPVFSTGKTAVGQVYMLCCDGFRHVVMPQEFFQYFNPSVMTSENKMYTALKEVTMLNISRNENDNISAILVKTC